MDLTSEPITMPAATGISNVLAPLDLSKRAEAALDWLRLLPMRRLTLLHVCDEASPGEEEAKAYLADLAARCRPPDCEVETRIVSGCAADSIVAAADQADLVVMSTRGDGDGGRRLFGSVADRVARHSPAPTLLLRGGSAPVSAQAVTRIVAPLDGSSTAERSLPLVSTLASTLGCDVLLVTVTDPSSSATSDAHLDQYLESRAARLRERSIPTATERRSGAAAPELLELVSPGDLLVMTTHGEGTAKRWHIGRVAEKLLRQAAAPVVLVRADMP